MLSQVVENGQQVNPTQDTLIDYEDRLVTSALTSDGIQWSPEVDTTTINTDVTILSVTTNPESGGSIAWVEFGLTSALKAVSSGTADSPTGGAPVKSAGGFRSCAPILAR